MKLKTLKEIWRYDEGDNTWGAKGGLVEINDLKEEAIKWYHRSDADKHKFIKEFFNLTDEELKKENFE